MQAVSKSRYIFREGEFRANFKEIEDIFRAYYPNYHIAYSYKTNYTPYICRVVKELGGYAEVVSKMEYDRAKAIGYTDDKIIYNGPCKEFMPDCIVNADSIDEIEMFVGRKIGIRINIDVGQSFVSRFGISDIEKAFEVAKGRIVGLHCHISQARSIEAWEKRTRLMLEIADKYFADGELEYIDLGSGMYGKMDVRMHAQFSNVPTYEDYAAVTAKLIAEHFKGKKNQPLFFTEPGTTLVSKYIDFEAPVECIKQIRGKTFVEVIASKHNLGEICELKKVPFDVITDAGCRIAVEDADIVGYTCLEHDVMYRGFCGEIGVGDIVRFGNVGGYSVVDKPPFIRPNFPMVTEDGKIIKRQETTEDIFATYE